MALKGSMTGGLIEPHHAAGCDQDWRHVRGRVEAVVVPERGQHGEWEFVLQVVYEEWCYKCGAADWDYVDTGR